MPWLLRHWERLHFSFLKFYRNVRNTTQWHPVRSSLSATDVPDINKKLYLTLSVAIWEMHDDWFCLKEQISTYVAKDEINLLYILIECKLPESKKKKLQSSFYITVCFDEADIENHRHFTIRSVCVYVILGLDIHVV